MSRAKQYWLAAAGTTVLIAALPAPGARADGTNLTATGATPIKTTLTSPIAAPDGVGLHATADQGVISITTTRRAQIRAAAGGILASTNSNAGVVLEIGADVAGATDAGGANAITSGENRNDGETILKTGVGDAIRATTKDGPSFIEVRGGNITSTGAAGVNARSAGAGAVTVHTAAAATVTTHWPMSAPPAIAGWSQSGPVRIATDGVVKAAGQAVFAYSVSGPVTIISNQDTSTEGPAALTAITRSGTASVVTGPGTEARPIQFTVASTTPAVLAYGHDIESVSVTGPASVVVGDHNSMLAGMPGVGSGNVVSLGIMDAADVAGVPSSRVLVGENDSFELHANNSAAIDAQLGRPGLYGPKGTASALARVGDNVSIHVSGYTDIGVVGFATDPSGAGKYASNGNVSVKVGTGSIVLDELGAAGAPTGSKTNIGIEALSGGGDVLVDNAAKINVSGEKDATVGLFAKTSDAGAATVSTRSSIVSNHGDGIDATTVGGAATVKVAAGDVTTNGGNAIFAKSDTGVVTIYTARSSTIANLGSPVTDNGVIGRTRSGPINIVTDGVVHAGHDAVAGFSVDGAVSIIARQDITAWGAGATGAHGVATGHGPVSVVIGSGTEQKPLAIKVGSGQGPDQLPLSGPDAMAVSALGHASTVIGNHAVMVSGVPGAPRDANVVAIALMSNADVGGVPSAKVVTGANDSFTLQGNNSGAVGAHIGQAGARGPNGSASADVSVGDNVSIHVSGLADTGVSGFVADPVGPGAYAGTGPVSVRVGSGSIRVDEDGATGALTGTKTNIGVQALSAGGDVLVDDAAMVDVSGGQDRTLGLQAKTAGHGAALIRSHASIASNNGDAIMAQSADGPAKVEVTSGTVKAANGDGVDAIAVGAGAVTVETGPSTTITSTPNPWGIGVHATSKSGPVSITSNGLVTAANEDVTGQSATGPVSVTINRDVIAVGGAAVTAMTLGASPASIVTASATAANPLHVTVQRTTTDLQIISAYGRASATVGDHNIIVTGQPGGSRVANVAAVGVMTAADTDGVPSVRVATGTGDSFTLRGNNSAALSAQIGRAGLQGPNGSASSRINVGDDVSIHVSGLSNSGVMGVVADRDNPTPIYAGTGDVSVTVGTGAIMVDELDATGPLTGAKTNVGVGAESGGGNVLVEDAAKIDVSGGQDSTLGLEAKTTGAGAATIRSRAVVASTQGDGLLARSVDGPALIAVLAGEVSAPAGAAVRASAAGGGRVRVEISKGAALRGETGVTVQAGPGGVELANAGSIQGGDGAGVVISDPTAGLIVTNAAGGVLSGQIVGANRVSVQNAGVWKTVGTSDFGTPEGASTNNFTNLGTIVVSQVDAAGAPRFDHLGAFANGSATATGVIDMAGVRTGRALTISGPFTGAPGHSVLSLNASLGRPDAAADVLHLTDGSAGHTLIRITDLGKAGAAPSPHGVVLVTGVTAAGDFGLDPSQPNYDARLHGIDRGGFVYQLTFIDHAAVLVGVPRQLAQR